MTKPARDAERKAPAPNTARANAGFAVPSLVFDNRTPYAAMQFDTIDQHDAAFHIFVAKIGYTLGACGADGLAPLLELDAPARLNVEDRHAGDDPSASVLEESDFAPYKPSCDVIVNAMAHAPRGEPVCAFEVGLSVMRPKPDGAPAAPEQRPGIQAAADDFLINKTLKVCGPRWFKKNAAMQRLLHWPVSIITFGMVRLNPWRLTAPTPVAQLPLRYEYALGGQCRIDRDEPAAKRVAKEHRLPEAGDTPSGSSAAGAPSQALAHDACESNPLGQGFTRHWFLDAARGERLPAPQIMAQDLPCSARQFWLGANGEPLPEPAGMGPIGRAWNPRRKLIGNIEQKPQWAPDDVPRLPPDFDFAYWNSAPLDQQCPYLLGRERFALTNLCHADSTAARLDHRGNTVLRFDLPRQAMFVLAIDRAKKLTVLPLEIDSVTIHPEARRLDLVWRGCLSADGRNVEARLMHIAEQAQIERLEQLIQHQWSVAPPPHPNDG